MWIKSELVRYGLGNKTHEITPKKVKKKKKKIGKPIEEMN